MFFFLTFRFFFVISQRNVVRKARSRCTVLLSNRMRYTKRDFYLAAYGGVSLRRFGFINVFVGKLKVYSVLRISFAYFYVFSFAPCRLHTERRICTPHVALFW